MIFLIQQLGNYERNKDVMRVLAKHQRGSHYG